VVAFATLLVLLTVRSAAAAGKDDFWKASGSQAAVVAGSQEAADAAIRILQRRNAVDATVTALLVLSVTDSGTFCFGGEETIASLS